METAAESQFTKNMKHMCTTENPLSTKNSGKHSSVFFSWIKSVDVQKCIYIDWDRQKKKKNMRTEVKREWPEPINSASATQKPLRVRVVCGEGGGGSDIWAASQPAVGLDVSYRLTTEANTDMATMASGFSPNWTTKENLSLKLKHSIVRISSSSCGIKSV